TLAPELPGALDLVRALAARDVVAAAGHTDATYEEAAAAFDAGVTYATHTFNAMRGLTARDPGAAGAVLVRDGVRAEVIADGRHVHPAAVALLVRAKGPEGVILVTDNVPPAGLPDGRYGRGGRAVTVAGGAALLPDGTLAGSTTPMHRMVANAARFAGVPLHTAVAMATRNPAAALGLEGEVGSLAPGRIADLVVLDAELTVHLTVVGGRVAYRSAALAEVAP
ncbi:MAG TPA: amidohydrolase family protein, partial [Dehalococcoidia bacterium]